MSLTATDWSDPTAALPQLRSAYYQLLAGVQAARITISTAAGSRDIQFHPADLTMLRNEIVRLEALIAPPPRNVVLWPTPP